MMTLLSAGQNAPSNFEKLVAEVKIVISEANLTDSGNRRCKLEPISHHLFVFLDNSDWQVRSDKAD